MSACEKSDQVYRYHDGELPAAERASFAEHLQSCAVCALELERMRRLSQFLRAASLPQMSPALLRRLHESVGELRARVIARTAELLAVAAGLVLAVCAGWAVKNAMWREVPVPTPASWEMAAVTLRADAEPIAAEQEFARWIIEDLSLENGHE